MKPLAKYFRNMVLSAFRFRIDNNPLDLHPDVGYTGMNPMPRLGKTK